MKKQELLLVIIVSLLMVSCGTPAAYRVEPTEKGIELTTTPGKLFGIFEVKGVPSGKYRGKVGDREIEVDTKPEPIIKADIVGFKPE